MPSYPRDASGSWLLSLGAAPAAQTRVTVRWTLVWTARQRTSCMEMDWDRGEGNNMLLVPRLFVYLP